VSRHIKRLEVSMSRRQFMIGAAGLSFGIALNGSNIATMLAKQRAGQTLSPWISIGTDGTITIMSAAVEMGQGSMTSLPLIIAEELDADWTKVKIVPAPPIEAIYGNPGFGRPILYTSSQNAVSGYYQPLRLVGAQVRRVLLDNAANRLGVPVAELTTEPSTVVHARSGRRLSYGEIASFAKVPAQAPTIRPEELKKPSDFRLIGKDVMRVDLPSKLNGSAIYSIDVQVPGMLYGIVLRAPVEGSAPVEVDESTVHAIPGVIRVVRLPYGVGALAETMWAALAARRALNDAVTWSRSGTGWGFDSEKGLEAFAADASNLEAPATDWRRKGDAAGEMARAATVLKATYRADYAYHAQMEPLNAVAAVSPDGDAVELWCGTQYQSAAVEAAARALGIPPARVKLNYLLLGGGFGRRGHRDEEFVVDAVLLSKEARRPVKVLWTRGDDVRNGRFRPITAHHVRAGLDTSGKLVAWHHRVAGDRVGPFQDMDLYELGGRKDYVLMAGVDLESYDIPHQWSELLYRDTGVRTSSLRGVGYAASTFVAETFLDEIARKRAIDPVQFRLELLRSSPRGRKVVETVARMAAWGRRREGRALGLAFVDMVGSLAAGIAEVSLDRPIGQITVHDFWCAADCGVQIQPDNIVAQLEGGIVYGLGLAVLERITVKDGIVEQTNFSDYRVPRMRETPAMHVELIPSDDHPVGVGQTSTPLVAPAIGNAVAQLTGIRLRELPMSRARVKTALG
jgi:isoquinoline 1-oxidoreductase subunit beta